MTPNTASRERVLNSLAHRASGPVPIDFGGTPVTGVHVRCVAAVRDYFGLEKRLIKVYEPYQMLGTRYEDLKQDMGVERDTMPH